MPLKTSFERKEGLVRSYATSNGKRLLRKAEPLNQPNVATVFSCYPRNVTALIARYDTSPASNTLAVCRARLGSAHTSLIVKVLSSTECLSPIDTRGWLISRGSGDDALLWGTDAATSCCEPVSIVVRLCEPHVCAACAPRELISDSDCVFGLFCVHAAFGNLCILSVEIDHATRKRGAIQNVVEAENVSTCYDMRSAGTAIRDLFALPVNVIYFGFCYVWICLVRIDEKLEFSCVVCDSLEY